jgi:protein-S-isoprenylcysteine O-methyltransferase Ste14
VTWALVYALALVVLVVRVRTPGAPPPEPLVVPAGEPFWLTRLHHGLFLALLAGVPLERLVIPGAAGHRPLGALLLVAGVALYRIAGRRLGEALSPFVEPVPGTALVTDGPYRWLRHPMYVSQALIAVGAPLTLGSRGVGWLAVPALLVLALRVRCEDEALARTFPEFPGYAARTRRIVPFLY